MSDARNTAPVIPGYTLRCEIEATIGAIARKRIAVAFKGKSAFTDGATFVQLPALSNSQGYTKDDADVMRGYGNHEAFHVDESATPEIPSFAASRFSARLCEVVFSDDPATAAKRRTEDGRKSLGICEKEYWTFKLWKSLENAMEDWRIEKVGIERWPGAKANLNQTRSHVNNRESRLLLEGKLDARTTPGMLVTMITWRGAMANDYACAAVASGNLDAASEKFPEDRAILDRIWPDVIACSSHQQVFALAHRVACDLADIYKNDDQPPEAEDGKQGRGKPPEDEAEGGSGGGGEGEGGDAKDDEQEVAEKDSGAEEKGAEGDPQGDGREPEGEPEAGEDDGQDASGRAEPDPDAGPGEDDEAGTGGPSSVGESAPRAGSAGSGDEDGADHEEDDRDEEGDEDPVPEVPVVVSEADDFPDDTLDIEDVIDRINEATEASSARDAHLQPVVVDRIADGDVGEYQALMLEAGTAASGMATALRRLLVSRNTRRERVGLAEGDLDLGNLVGIVTGSQYVYGRVDQSRATNAAMLLVLDNSSSMDTPEEDPDRAKPGPAAGRSGLKAAVRTRMRILGMATAAIVNATATNKDVATAITTYTNDHRAIRIRVHKGFEQPGSIGRAAAGGVLRSGAKGGTPTAIALLEGHRMIYRRPEGRKIVIFVTDGDADDRAATQEAAMTLMAAGIIVIGIGVGAGAKPMDIPGWTSVSDINMLPTAMMAVVGAALLQRRAG